MIVSAKGFLVDVSETESGDRVYLNGKLKSSPFDWQYLNVGVRISLDSVDLISEHEYILDISQSFKDNKEGKKSCFTHINVVGVR